MCCFVSSHGICYSEKPKNALRHGDTDRDKNSIQVNLEVKGTITSITKQNIKNK